MSKRKLKPRRKHELQNSPSSTHPVVPSPVPDGMQIVPEGVGSKILRDGARTRVATGETTTAIVPIAAQFTTVRASENQSGEKTLESLEPYRDVLLQRRADKIDAGYVGDVIEGVNLPPQVIETTQRWLRTNNLIWASNDIEFWAALDYVLDGLESFSVDAIEQALIVCTTKSSDSPARRAVIYAELKSLRAIKKIRDMKLRIRTAEVVATRSLMSAGTRGHLEFDMECEANHKTQCINNPIKTLTEWSLLPNCAAGLRLFNSMYTAMYRHDKGENHAARRKIVPALGSHEFILICRTARLADSRGSPARYQYG